jgi:ATP-binding protein involved in chromosome partitioning
MALNLGKTKPKDIVFADDLAVEWRDGTTTHYPFFALRDACPCAGCVDELSGRKTLDPKSIPVNIHIRKCEYVGNYAIRIDWSDGHNSGIYTFRFLRDLSELKLEKVADVTPAAN